MAIRFEQGEGAVISAAQGYGQLQQQNANRDFAVRAYAASQEAGARNQANANQVSRINADVNIAELEAQTRNYQTSEGAMARVEEQRMQSETAMQLQQGKFNYADNIRLQRLEQGRSWVEQQLNDGQITRQEANELLGSVDGESNILELRRTQAQGNELRERATQEGARAAAMEQVERARGQFAAGSIMRRRDPLTGQMVEMQWNRHDAMWERMDGGGGRGSSSGGGGGGNGQISDQQLTTISRQVDDMLSPTNTTTTPEMRQRLSTAEGRRQAILERAQDQQWVQSQLNIQNRAAQSLRVGGPLPFQPSAPAPEGQSPPRIEQVQDNINNLVERAEQVGRTEEAGQLRQFADRFRQSQGNTGTLSPQDQQLLVRAGYYRDEFQPDVDRALSFASRPIAAPGPGQQVPNAGVGLNETTQGVSERRMIPNPNAPHANAMRQLLVDNGSRERMSATQRAAFDLARSRLGFAEWPPRRQTPQDREDVQSAPGVQPNQPAFQRQGITNEQRRAGPAAQTRSGPPTPFVLPSNLNRLRR